MNKKQVFAVSLVAAIPAIGLAVFLGIGLTHMISDGANVSVPLWIVWGLAMLGALIIGFLPLAILIFKGLLPEPGIAMAAAGAVGAISGTTAASRATRAGNDTDEEFLEGDDSDYAESDEEDDASDDGESLFEDGVEDDFDDDFEGFGSRGK
ncbi:MAG: hypothetical protein ACK58L_04345 [Planctomycetota bacterium]